MSDESLVLERSGDISQIVAEVLPLPTLCSRGKEERSFCRLLVNDVIPGRSVLVLE